MRDGKCLAELEPVYWAFEHLVEDGVCVLVESLHIAAGVQHRGVSGTAEIKLGHAAVTEAMRITFGRIVDPRFRSLE